MSDVKLPPLPEAEHILDGTASQDGYSAEALQAYARQAVLMERERCATLCDGEHFGGQRDDDLSWTACAAHLAAAIRKGAPHPLEPRFFRDAAGTIPAVAGDSVPRVKNLPPAL